MTIYICAPNRAFPTVGESGFGNTVEATPLRTMQTNVHAHHTVRPPGLYHAPGNTA